MHDAFICYAHEDQQDVANPLALKLIDSGLDVWYDEFSLAVGDSLSETVDRGLANSRYGIVILSRHFLDKNWPKRELRGLTTRAIDGKSTILPIWHSIEKDEISAFSPPLADVLALNTKNGVETIARHIISRICNEQTRLPTALARAERLYEIGHYQAAVVIATAHLEEELRRYALKALGKNFFRAQPLRSYSLGRLLSLMEQRGILKTESGDRWVVIVNVRNQAAHGDVQPSKGDTRWILSEIASILESI